MRHLEVNQGLKLFSDETIFVLPQNWKRWSGIYVRFRFAHLIKHLTVCDLLGLLQQQEPCFRAVVFSQFTSFLDLIEVALRREHFDQYRFDGSMDIKKRNQAVSGFRLPSNKPKVLIVSLKAGGEVSRWSVPNVFLQPIHRSRVELDSS